PDADAGRQRQADIAPGPVPRLRLRFVARNRRETPQTAGAVGERIAMTLTVILFAAARDLAGADSVAVELPAGATVADLRTKLSRQVPAFAKLLGKSAIAVNHDFADDGFALKSADEVAIIPPVSGG